jgi:hypothetical protein
VRFPSLKLARIGKASDGRIRRTGLTAIPVNKTRAKAGYAIQSLSAAGRFLAFQKIKYFAVQLLVCQDFLDF